MENITAELLAAILGVVLSLALSYIPGLKSAWDALDTDRKQMWTGILLVVIAGSVYGGSCAGVLPYECNWLNAVGALIAALVASQSMHRLTKG